MNDDIGGDFSLFKHDFVELTMHISVVLWLDEDERIEISVSLGEDDVDDANDWFEVEFRLLSSSRDLLLDVMKP